MMKKIMWLFVLLLLLVLTACGGESKNDVAQGTESFVSMMSAEVAPIEAAISPMSTTVTADMTMDWAERTFPEFFPIETREKYPQIQYEGVLYNARSYVGIGGISYLGITQDGRIFGLGDFTAYALQQFETIDYWADQVLANLKIPSVSSAYYIQSRSFENQSYSERAGLYASLRSDLTFDDIQSIYVLDGNENSILSKNDFIERDDELNQYRCDVDGCSFRTLKDLYYFKFIDNGLLAGNYTFRLQTNQGEVITQKVYYPGKVVIPHIDSGTVSAEWGSDESLSISWQNPTSEWNWDIVDVIRINISSPHKEDFYLTVVVPKDTTYITVPNEVITQTFDGIEQTELRIVHHTRAHDENGHNYSRAFSSRATLIKPNAGVQIKFTKIDSSGNLLPESATSWSCVLDHESDLVWEVKVDDGGLRDRDWVYTAYEETGENGNGYCDETMTCNQFYYRDAVNMVGLCGYNDWRLAQLTELEKLALPSIVTKFFPNTKAAKYWTGSGYGGVTNSISWVDFQNFSSGSTRFKDIQNHVRLVRDSMP